MGLLQGCSAGFWSRNLNAWNITTYSPKDLFNIVFDVDVFDNNVTLLEVIRLNAVGPSPQVEQLSRQAVAAILNATDPRVLYPLTEAEVKSIYHNAITDGTIPVITKASEFFDRLNNLGCPIPAN